MSSDIAPPDFTSPRAGKQKSHTDQGLRLVNRNQLFNAVSNMLGLFLESPDFAEKVKSIMGQQPPIPEPPPQPTQEPIHLIGHPGPDGTWIEHP